MESRNIYEEIALRTNGDIYIGVVGPVRTGKSTFIKQFMETLVIPNIDNVYRRERAKDELPQSGSGRTIMTAEPKFVPEEAVEVNLAANTKVKVRMIDCVGYMVNGALGQFEDDMPRMVTTPWFEKPIPMSEAAEIGTRKVITDHSTIGLVITTDGSVTDIPREDYIEAESRVISELKALNKPFLVLLNTANPHSESAQNIKKQIENTYNVTCIAVDCARLNRDEIGTIIRQVLYEFPVSEFGIKLPKWVSALPSGHPLKGAVYSGIMERAGTLKRIRNVEDVVSSFTEIENISGSSIDSINLGEGKVVASLTMSQDLFYQILREHTGFQINDEGDLIPLLSKLSSVKLEYDRLYCALQQVRQTGYGIVMPTIEELKLEEPEIVKQGGRFGVKLRASAPSIHLIQANIETEVSPIVGTERQSEELVQYLLSEFDGKPEKIWESNIFGKSLSELVSEGLNNKLNRMPDEARGKIQETLERIINEGSGGLVCIIL
ncbi:MAG: stage IV sporulation protein A [Clostridiales bacterium]|nr:stage IV sporulation protein A [Clostridiales bacterium]